MLPSDKRRVHRQRTVAESSPGDAPGSLPTAKVAPMRGVKRSMLQEAGAFQGSAPLRPTALPPADARPSTRPLMPEEDLVPAKRFVERPNTLNLGDAWLSRPNPIAVPDPPGIAPGSTFSFENYFRELLDDPLANLPGSPASMSSGVHVFVGASPVDTPAPAGSMPRAAGSTARVSPTAAERPAVGEDIMGVREGAAPISASTPVDGLIHEIGHISFLESL